MATVYAIDAYAMLAPGGFAFFEAFIPAVKIFYFVREDVVYHTISYKDDW
jgi:hypothetical protein